MPPRDHYTPDRLERPVKGRRQNSILLEYCRDCGTILEDGQCDHCGGSNDDRETVGPRLDDRL